MLNQLVVIGRLTKDPELRKTDAGRNVTTITLAVPRSYKNSNGEYDTDFIDCTLWSNVAETTTEYCHKGDLLGVRGRIQTRMVEKKEENLDAEIEKMIEERQAARKARDFKRADEIRDELLAQGIILEDTREGVKWKRA